MSEIVEVSSALVGIKVFILPINPEDAKTNNIYCHNLCIELDPSLLNKANRDDIQKTLSDISDYYSKKNDGCVFNSYATRVNSTDNDYFLTLVLFTDMLDSNGYILSNKYDYIRDELIKTFDSNNIIIKSIFTMLNDPNEVNLFYKRIAETARNIAQQEMKLNKEHNASTD